MSSLLPAHICHWNYARSQSKLDSGREIKKSRLHTQKISLEFHGHKVINCFSFSLLHHIFSSLHQRRKSCLKVHAPFPFILKSNINTENGDARICLNERLSCTIAANFLEILAPVHTWRFNVSCFEVLEGVLVVKCAFATAILKIETLRMRRRFARVFSKPECRAPFGQHQESRFLVLTKRSAALRTRMYNDLISGESWLARKWQFNHTLVYLN